MDLSTALSFGISTPRDLLGWLLLTAIAAKIVSTGVLLAQRHVRIFDAVARHADAIWWTTKLSALIICGCASLLCRIAGDVAAQAGFTALLLAA